jgi:bla regulator protein blaR1
MIHWLAGTLIATSVLMALVLLVREPVRRQFGPAAAYGLWLIPTLRLMMPPLTTTIERAVPGVHPLSLLLPQPASPSIMPAVDSSLIQQFGGWENLALSGWLIGAVIMLLGGLLVYRWQRREVLRDSVQMTRAGNIRIVRSAAVRGPIAFGMFDRVIALPIDFEDRYEAQERRLALDHELAHHRSGDLLVSQFAYALLCLQWFNPLAWMSHSAFRFDQEAACDARVLARVNCEHRGAYARAIAKAASGRALLFAGALDRPRTLHRRLASMLATPSRGRRVAGKTLIALTAVVAVPLTASRATEYIDAPAAHHATAIAVAAPATDAAAPRAAAERVSAAAPAALNNEVDAELPIPDLKGVTLGKNDVAFFADDTVLIDQRRKRLEQLTAAERARLRAVILKSQREQAQERAELPRRLAEAQMQADRARSGELRREFLRDRKDLRRDLAEVDSEAAELRAGGEDPEKRKAEIRQDLRELEATDIDKEVREAIEDNDPAKIMAELYAEEHQMARMLRKLDRLDGR